MKNEWRRCDSNLAAFPAKISTSTSVTRRRDYLLLTFIPEHAKQDRDSRAEQSSACGLSRRFFDPAKRAKRRGHFMPKLQVNAICQISTRYSASSPGLPARSPALHESRKLHTRPTPHTGSPPLIGLITPLEWTKSETIRYKY